MKNKFFFTRIFTVIILFIILCSPIVKSAPMPRQVAINEKTNQCGAFWGGDEFNEYKLKQGWQAFYPKIKFEIVTDYGNCTLLENSDASECCKQLGLSYINYKDIPYNQNKIGENICDLPYHSDGIESYEGISINTNTKQCSELLSYRLKDPNDKLGNSDQDSQKNCLIDKNWKDFRKTNIIGQVYETSRGICEVSGPGDGAKQCCSQLGLKYSSFTTANTGNIFLKILIPIFFCLILVIMIFSLVLFIITKMFIKKK
jgi:hypothetical protein